MLPEMSVQLIVFLICVGAYTLAAAIWDIRIKRIPNKLTIPVFGLGLVYQVAFNQVDGLLAAAAGFAAGFGLLFVLWMIGSGGGGDVKLMGALGVWLGGKLTLMVLVGSTLMAAIGTFFVIVFKATTHGVWASKDRYMATGKLKKGEKPRKETLEQKQQRRTMGYAVPVALATWLVVAWQIPKFPWMAAEPDQQPVAVASPAAPAPPEAPVDTPDTPVSN
jgi:prepilin peptidase CpaA